YQLSLEAELVDFTGDPANFGLIPPLEARLNINFLTQEAWIYPTYNWSLKDIHVTRKLSVPFQIDEDSPYPELIFRAIEGHRVRIKSIQLHKLENLPFLVHNSRTLEFELPAHFLSKGADLELPRFYMPGYFTSARRDNGEKFHIPVELSEQG